MLAKSFPELIQENLLFSLTLSYITFFKNEKSILDENLKDYQFLLVMVLKVCFGVEHLS